MREITDFGAGFGEKLVIFRPSFFDARFGSSRTFGEEIAGDVDKGVRHGLLTIFLY